MKINEGLSYDHVLLPSYYRLYFPCRGFWNTAGLLQFCIHHHVMMIDDIQVTLQPELGNEIRKEENMVRDSYAEGDKCSNISESCLNVAVPC